MVLSVWMILKKKKRQEKMYLKVVLLFHFHGDNRRYKFPQDNPTTHKTDTTRALTNKTLRFFATWRVKVRICNLPASSIFLKKYMGFSDRLSINAIANGNPNAMQL